MSSDRRRGKSLGVSRSPYENAEFPDRLKKDGCIYLNGEVTFSSRGVYKVMMENDMEALCTATKMDHRRIGILLGDKVTVEVPTASLSPGSPIRARIIWRTRPGKKG